MAKQHKEEARDERRDDGHGRELFPWEVSPGEQSAAAPPAAPVEEQPAPTPQPAGTPADAGEPEGGTP